MQLSKEEINTFEALRHTIHCGIFSRVSVPAFTTGLKYSQRAISEKFSFLYQYTLLEYYNTVSMEYAESLLAEDRSVKEISFMLGYKSVANFSRTFRRIMGKTASSNKRKISAVQIAKIGNSYALEDSPVRTNLLKEFKTKNSKK